MAGTKISSSSSRAGFRSRLITTLAEARSVLGDENSSVFSGLGYAPIAGSLDDAVLQIASALELGQLRPARMRELAVLLGQLTRTRGDLIEYRLNTYAQIEAELDALQHVGTLEGLFERAPAAVTRCCNIDEAGLWAIRDGAMALVKLHCADDEQRAAMLTAELTPVPLHAQLLEMEVVRRRAGVLVLNARSDPRVDRPTQARFATDAHVTVPIMPEGKVVGFFHGGCFPDNRLVDPFDFDAIATFARGFSHVLERVVLRTRILRQRDYFQRMVAAGSDLSSRLANEEIGLVEFDENAPTDKMLAPPLPPEARIRSLLTPREVDVLQLMAAGRTNAEIANELVVSVGTVKFHVRHILNKLNATNRAQAVSRYMRVAAAERLAS